jgi:hypothetical protein
MAEKRISPAGDPFVHPFGYPEGYSPVYEGGVWVVRQPNGHPVLDDENRVIRFTGEDERPMIEAARRHKARVEEKYADLEKALAFEREGEIVRASEPDTHELLREVLDASGWSVEKREDWLTQYFYAAAEEQEEEMEMLRQWEGFGGSDPGEDEPARGWAR